MEATEAITRSHLLTVCTYTRPPAALGTRVSHSDQFWSELLTLPVFPPSVPSAFVLTVSGSTRPDYQHTTPSVWASPESHTVTIGNTGYTGITGNLLSCNRLPASPRSWRLITDQTNLSSVG